MSWNATETGYKVILITGCLCVCVWASYRLCSAGVRGRIGGGGEGMRDK